MSVVKNCKLRNNKYICYIVRLIKNSQFYNFISLNTRELEEDSFQTRTLYMGIIIQRFYNLEKIAFTDNVAIIIVVKV